MAEDDWADVQLIVGSRCQGRREEGLLDGAGISYFTASDETTFVNYWPQEEMWGGNPCPHQVSSAQIALLRRLVAEARARAVTGGEKRVLARVDERLSVVNGAALMTDAGGWCSDTTAEEWEAERRTHIPRVKEDVW